MNNKYNKFNKPSTITIDTKFKESYYSPAKSGIETSNEQSGSVFWNYLMNVSMQNTVSQMVNR